MDFDDQVVVKRNPELRHIVAHLMNAIEDLAHQRPRSALDNLASIEGLVLFDPEEIEMVCRNRKMPKAKPARKAKPKAKPRRK